MDDVTASDGAWKARARTAWNTVVGAAWIGALFVVVLGALRLVPLAISFARVHVNQVRCSSRLSDYVGHAIPGRRDAHVEGCRLPDAKTGYCFVSALGDDGIRRTEGLPVNVSRQNAIDVDKFVDEEAAKKGALLPVAETVLDRIAAAGTRR